ncbi:MAG: DUF4138 domain-containing protein [Bacteroidota bacterium]
MKTPIVILLLTLTGQFASGQRHMKEIRPSEILYVSDIKTTHLIFDESITYVDLGSPYFIADTVQTLVKLRHIGEDVAKPISQETNLTVITEDGAYHSIPIRYNRDTRQLTYRVNRGGEYIKKTQQGLEAIELRQEEIKRFADRLKYVASNIEVHSKREDFGMSVTGIFYESNFIALRLNLVNGSAIDLDIDHILFRLKLKPKVSSEYIYQERILKPVHVVGNITKLEGYNSKSALLIFDKFTPNKNERLSIDVLEKDGGRSSQIIIPRKKLINPQAL